MHLYLNYAREHWMREGENFPIGLILCTQKDASVAHYSLDGLPNKVLASEYKTVLPDTKLIAKELTKARKLLEKKIIVKINYKKVSAIRFIISLRNEIMARSVVANN